MIAENLDEPRPYDAIMTVFYENKDLLLSGEEWLALSKVISPLMNGSSSHVLTGKSPLANETVPAPLVATVEAALDVDLPVYAKRNMLCMMRFLTGCLLATLNPTTAILESAHAPVGLTIGHRGQPELRSG